jgi:hypothetical protein
MAMASAEAAVGTAVDDPQRRRRRSVRRHARMPEATTGSTPSGNGRPSTGCNRGLGSIARRIASTVSEVPLFDRIPRLPSRFAPVDRDGNGPRPSKIQARLARFGLASRPLRPDHTRPWSDRRWMCAQRRPRAARDIAPACRPQQRSRAIRSCASRPCDGSARRSAHDGALATSHGCPATLWPAGFRKEGGHAGGLHPSLPRLPPRFSASWPDRPTVRLLSSAGRGRQPGTTRRRSGRPPASGPRPCVRGPGSGVRRSGV